MAAITATADGAYVYLAVEVSTFPAVVRAERDALAVWETVYNPGAGTSINVTANPYEVGVMFFYGNFGTDVVIIKHDVGTLTNADISPASLGAKVVNQLAVNPDNGDELYITVDTDQDLLKTTDGGATWDVVDSVLQFDATALWVLWSGLYVPHRYFVAGDNLTDLDVLYSPSDGNNDTHVENATVGALANISNIEATEA